MLFCILFSADCLCPMPLMLCLWAQSLVFINSGAKSLASLSSLITEPTSPWRWPNVIPIAPVASVATSTLSHLMNTQLRKVWASTLDMWELEQWAWESSLESRKWYESQALSNRKSSYSVQENITTWKKTKDICGRMRLSEKSVNLLVCVCVLSGFLTEDSYDFANSWAMKGAAQSCRRVSNPTHSCNSTRGTAAVNMCLNTCKNAIILHLIYTESLAFRKKEQTNINTWRDSTAPNLHPAVVRLTMKTTVWQFMTNFFSPSAPLILLVTMLLFVNKKIKKTSNVFFPL